MRSTFKILFYINRQKTKADGRTVILCRITIDGKSTAITTGEECNPSEWNSKQGLTTDRKTSQRLHEFRELVEKTYRDILIRDGVVSVELIKNHLQGITTHPTTLLAMSRAELQMVRESVGKSRTEGTYLNLSHADRNLHEFVKDKGVQDILIGAITEGLFEEYRFYLKKRGLKGTTINNYLCWLSRLMYRAVSRNIIRCNPFENAKYEKEDKNIRYLQKYDVARLMAMKEFEQDGMAVNCGQILMCDGGCATLYINYKRTEMRAGSMLLMKPGDIVRGEDVSDDYQVSCLAYDDSILREASFRVESMVSDYLSRGFYTTDPFLRRFFHQVLGVVETLMKEESHEALRDVTVMQLRSFFLVCYERFVRDNADIRRKRKDELYSRFFDLLTRNYREEPSVSFYADRMNMTARYLNEIANHSTGQSAKALIDDYVITQLCMALQISTKTITQIAWEYNFESLSSFCDYFKRRMGMTPQKFREK